MIIGAERRDKLYVGVVCNLWLSWSTPQLRHVYFHGTIYFDNPKETDCCRLESLQAVSYVVEMSCAERILKRIPNLKKLKIHCSGFEDTACLNELVHLNRLQSFGNICRLLGWTTTEVV